MEKGQLVELGFCHSVHGIKGGLKFWPENSRESVLKKKDIVTLFPKSDKSSLPEKGKEFEISNIVFGHKVMIYFEGIQDRNAAEDMIPFSLKIPRESFPEIEDDEVYLVDLVGSDVFDHVSGGLLGKIERYYEHPGQMVAVIRMEEGTLELPFVENFFPKIEECGDAYRIEINQPEIV